MTVAPGRTCRYSGSTHTQGPDSARDGTTLRDYRVRVYRRLALQPALPQHVSELVDAFENRLPHRTFCICLSDSQLVLIPLGLHVDDHRSHCMLELAKCRVLHECLTVRPLHEILALG